MVWHRDTELPDVDLILIPGGFSYGDYLRCGAMAAHSPVMREVAASARREAWPCSASATASRSWPRPCLLPGALLRNASLKFVCHSVTLKVENSQTLFTSGYEKGQTLSVPVAHGDGNYFAEEATLDRLEERGQIALPLRRRQPQRLGPRHRRRLQRDQERPGHDAPPRERHRSAARQHRRLPLFSGLVQALS